MDLPIKTAEWQTFSIRNRAFAKFVVYFKLKFLNKLGILDYVIPKSKKGILHIYLPWPYRGGNINGKDFNSG